ncbi:uncharacterized protein LOC144489508, partial [Mustelus asterias]
MRMKSLPLAMFAVALLLSLTAEAEAGVSFHPRLKGDNSSGNAKKSSPKRQLCEDVALQVEEGQSDSAVAQAGLPSQLELRTSKADSTQYGEQMLQMLSALLGSD